MDTSEVVRKREFGLVREADKVRTVLVVFCALFLLVMPPPPGELLNLACCGLCVAAFSTLLTRFFVDWDALQSRKAVSTAAGMILLGDLTWVMMFIAGTGGFVSPFNMLLLILILFAGVFFGTLPFALPLITAVVVAWYAGTASAYGLDVQGAGTLAAEIISAVAVGWLGYGLSGVLERERQTNVHIVRNLTEGILLLNEVGTVVLANPRILEMLDLPEGEILGRSAWSTTAPAGFRQVLSDLRAVSGSVRQTSSMLVLGEENPRDMRISTIPCAVGARTPLGWVVVVEDVTDLRASARMQEEGLAIVSHELRSPLATLGGLAQVLERLGEQMDEAQKAQAVAALSEETRRLGRMVATLLDAGHLERGAYTLAPETLDAGPLLEQLTTSLRRRAEGRVEVTCTVEAGLPLLWADPLRLELVLSNLGDNALKYTPEGGRVRLQARAREGQVILSVSDTGPGIPASEQLAVFEKYSRGADHHETQGRQEGLGLGLFVARRIVQLHGGELRLSSQVGQGSTFEVFLPTAESQALQRAA
jgi:signal transduction histidine kinase